MEVAAKQSSIDITSIRKQFPILTQEVNGYPLTYLDNAATTQKPQRVINALNSYYSSYNSNIHRGVHTLAEQATNAFETTRKTLQKFINSRESEEIIYTKGTSDSINLVAATYGRMQITKGDEIIITGLEHHSNIVPWQMLCEEKGAILKVVPISNKGEISIKDFQDLLSTKTKIVSIALASNALGTINPVKEIITKAHNAGAIVLLDAAQALSHLTIDVQQLDCDFLAGSVHKMYGPTGVGFLYGKRHLLEEMPPYQGGGEMIKEVTFEKTTYNTIPFKFEAGTPNIADIIATNEALHFINEVGKENIHSYENKLLIYGTQKLQAIDKLKLIGTADQKVGVLSFIMEGMHPFDVGMMLDARGIAVRTGHHCTMPLMAHFGLEGTIRASLAIYNTFEEIDVLAESLANIANRIK